MQTFQLCACGAAPGYPHRADCPRPLFNPTDSQFEQWEKEWLAKVSKHPELAVQNAGCDRCGVNDKMPGSKLCQHCAPFPYAPQSGEPEYSTDE